MEIVYDQQMVEHYVAAASDVSPQRPILIEKFLENAIQAGADAISDGQDAFVPAVMEHIELAGIHSGDSACVIPPVSIAQKHLQTSNDYTRRIALALNVAGLINVRFAICEDTLYVLVANPRASRTVPLVSKVCNIPMARSRRSTELSRRSDWRAHPRCPCSVHAASATRLQSGSILLTDAGKRRCASPLERPPNYQDNAPTAPKD